MSPATIFYVHDPMCSWCYGFSPTWQQLERRLTETFSTEQLTIEYMVGGLAPDTQEDMPLELRQKLQQVWRLVSERTGAQFNHDFWQHNTPRRATYLSCRACLLARDAGLEPEMIDAIQQAYYQEARNPSDSEVLVDCASQIGLDPHAFAQQLSSPDVTDRLLAEIARSRTLGMNTFPSIGLESQGRLVQFEILYGEPEILFQQINSYLSP